LTSKYFDKCGTRERRSGGFGREGIGEGFGCVGACGGSGAKKRGGLLIVGGVSAGEGLAIGGLVEAEDGFDEGDEAGPQGAAPVFLVFLCFKRFLLFSV
jgi:hypothetical protein